MPDHPQATVGTAPAAAQEPVCIRLDERPHAVAAGTTLADLIAQLGHAETAVASALNARFVARERRRLHVLQSGDTVLLFQPIVGG